MENSSPNSRQSIGTLNERTLHTQLKTRYRDEGSAAEVVVDGYVVDILRRDGTVVEIQTGSLSKLKAKLAALLCGHRVLLVYPLAVEKRLMLFDAPQRRLLSARMSPRRPRFLDIFRELVGLASVLGNPAFELEVLLTREEEIRRRDGKGSWRRRGITIVDRSLVAIQERVRLSTPADYLALLPEPCPEEFTNRDLAALCGIGVRTAGQLTYCLRAMGALAVRGKRGRALLFGRSLAPPAGSIV